MLIRNPDHRGELRHLVLRNLIYFVMSPGRDETMHDQNVIRNNIWSVGSSPLLHCDACSLCDCSYHNKLTECAVHAHTKQKTTTQQQQQKQQQRIGLHVESIYIYCKP